jgi:uncharacterized membrane protein YfcA
MNSAFPYLLTVIVLFISTFTRSALGFADALIAMPLLTIVLGLKTAAPLVALVATTSSFVILIRHWHVVDLPAAWRIIVALLLGIPVGLFGLYKVSEPLMQTILGVLLMLFSIANLIRFNLIRIRLVIPPDGVALAYVFGFVAGVIGGAYNTVGPLLAIYGHLRRWSPEQFRATLQGCFLPAYGCIVIGHGVAGLLTPRVLVLYGVSLPLAGVAIVLGERLNALFPRDQFVRYVNLALLLIGLMLCIQARAT